MYGFDGFYTRSASYIYSIIYSNRSFSPSYSIVAFVYCVYHFILLASSCHTTTNGMAHIYSIDSTPPKSFYAITDYRYLTLPPHVATSWYYILFVRCCYCCLASCYFNIQNMYQVNKYTCKLCIVHQQVSVLVCAWYVVY